MINVAEIVDRLGPTEATSVIMDALQKGDYIDIDQYDEWLETFEPHEECGYLLLDTPLGLLAGTIQYWTGVDVARSRIVFRSPFDPPPSPPKRVIDQFAR